MDTLSDQQELLELIVKQQNDHLKGLQALIKIIESRNTSPTGARGRKRTNEGLCIYFPSENPLLCQLTPDEAAQALWRGNEIANKALESYSSSNPQCTIERTDPSIAYPGEIEVTEDLAERFHAALFVKLVLFVLLFDMDLQYLTILIFVFFLHIHGVFEPILRFFRRRVDHRQRQIESLDRVLQNLHQRREIQRENDAATEGLQRISQRAENSPTTDAAIPQDQTCTTSTTETAQSESPIASPEISASTQSPPPPYWWRLTYQSIVMFLGTAIPWWAPDQRYLV